MTITFSARTAGQRKLDLYARETTTLEIQVTTRFQRLKGRPRKMGVLSFFRRRSKSRYVDDKAVEDFERVLKQSHPSAFDVAMEETRIADADAWEQIKRDFKREV